jgi:hypothetical protein
MGTKIKQDYKVNIIMHHVKAHPDKHKSYEELIHHEQMNIIADSLTKESKQFQPTPYIEVPSNQVNLIINDEYILANIAQTCKKCYHSIDARDYYKQKYNWSNKELDTILWKPLAIALKNQNYTDHLAVQKFIHGYSRTKYREHKYYDYIPQTCPICTTATENEDHILKCLTSPRHQLRQQWISELSKHLTTYCPTIMKDLIIQNIHQWLEPTVQQPMHQDIPECLTKAIAEQSNLGWDHFLKGRITDIWGPVLTQLRNNPIYKIKSKIDVTTWATRITKINFKFIL